MCAVLQDFEAGHGMQQGVGYAGRQMAAVLLTRMPQLQATAKLDSLGNMPGRDLGHPIAIQVSNGARQAQDAVVGTA